MGWKYEVTAWVQQKDRIATSPGMYITPEYTYQNVYVGNSLLAALIALVNAKHTASCVKFEWR